jgi:hypothetical protein
LFTARRSFTRVDYDLGPKTLEIAPGGGSLLRRRVSDSTTRRTRACAGSSGETPGLKTTSAEVAVIV